MHCWRALCYGAILIVTIFPFPTAAGLAREVISHYAKLAQVIYGDSARGAVADFCISRENGAPLGSRAGQRAPKWFISPRNIGANRLHDALFGQV